MGRSWVIGVKSASSAKKAALFTKIMKEVAVACREGGASPDGNARLRAALEAARKASVPRDTIDRALKKAAGAGADSYESVVYEGFAPHQVPVIVSCLTDNKNRTASQIRVLFRGGQMTSVAWMFDSVGIIEATHSTAKDAEEAAIESGAQDLEKMDASELGEGAVVGATFYTGPSDLDSVRHALTDAGWSVSKAELGYRPKTPMQLSGGDRDQVVKFLDALDDEPDVHRLYTALD
ncbi:MAG TPA: YebC/PmpR family DNA-binding transcriptional regulator [Bdellovibrionota bacterium]|jgi:YebC/PmpR family DNA-binding regulatory protein|nr:YebC/PmpR family DNA-binding transcriptional regulator [Bdellovibrionota bacterium]